MQDNGKSIYMKLNIRMIAFSGLAAAMVSCGDKAADKDFKYLVDEFADLKIMRYQVPGWDGLTLQQKEYVYHLAEAAKYGRDIIWMQNFKDNLAVRKVLENVLENYTGDKTVSEYEQFETYAKRVFFSKPEAFGIPILHIRRLRRFKTLIKKAYLCLSLPTGEASRAVLVTCSKKS